MTYQRSRGIAAKVWATEEQEDARGNTVFVLSATSINATVWTFPQRGAKAEVPGQQKINVTRIGTAIMEGVNLWSQLEFMGKKWDVVSPPAYHHGTRHTRHWSIDIRERPDG